MVPRRCLLAFLLLTLAAAPAAEAARVELPPLAPLGLAVGEAAMVDVPVRLACAGNEAWVEPVVVLSFTEDRGVTASAEPVSLESRACLGETLDLLVPARFAAGPAALGDMDYVVGVAGVLRTSTGDQAKAEGQASVVLAFRPKLEVEVGPPVQEDDVVWTVRVANRGDSPTDVGFHLKVPADGVEGFPVAPTPVRLLPGESQQAILLYANGPATTLEVEAVAFSLRDGTVGDRVQFSVEAPKTGRQAMDLPEPALVLVLMGIGVAVTLRRRG